MKGYVYHVTEPCGDTPRGPWTAAQAHRYAKTLAEVLGTIHGEKSVQWADVEGWKRSVTSLSEECQEEVVNTDEKKYVSSVTSWLQAVETNNRVSHGDVKLGNTIVGGGGSLTHMVDWEHVKLRSKYFDLAKAELRILRSHFKHCEGIDACIDRFRQAYPEQLDERILNALELLKAFRIRGRLGRRGPFKDWVKRRSENISDVYDDIIAHLKRVTPIIE
jgi:aminoglycoside phosphotransferase (APT) family kinase protein